MAVLAGCFSDRLYPNFLNLFPKMETNFNGVDMFAFYSTLPVIGT
jgi:hypothetical protein